MIQTEYEGDAKRVLQTLLDLFAKVEYDPEESGDYGFIEFS